MAPRYRLLSCMARIHYSSNRLILWPLPLSRVPNIMFSVQYTSGAVWSRQIKARLKRETRSRMESEGMG